MGPVVTEAAAAAMAEGVCRATGSDVGLGITGVAGPDDQEGVAPGTVFVGLRLPDGRVDPGRSTSRAIGSGSASTGPSPRSTCCAGPSSTRIVAGEGLISQGDHRRSTLGGATGGVIL